MQVGSQVTTIFIDIETSVDKKTEEDVRHRAAKNYLVRPEDCAGLTPDQRFFISFGQIWAGSFRPEEQKRRLVVDPHSPGKYRVIGVLSNMPEFYQAFGVKAGDQMYRDEAVRGKVW